LNINKTSFLAWLLFGITLVVTLVNLPSAVASGNVQGSVVKIVGVFLEAAAILAFPLVGALIVSRQPQNIIGWLLMVPSFGIPMDLFVRSQIVGVTVPPAHPSIFFWMAAYLSNITWLFVIFPVFFIALLFPTGRPLSPRWRWAVAYAIGMVGFFFSIAFFDKRLTPNSDSYGVDWSLPNPLGFFDTSTNENIFTVWFAGLVVLALLCVAGIVLRYRRAVDVERKQINWLLYAISLFGTVYVLYTLFRAWWTDFLTVSTFLIPIPLAIGIAILRYRLYDIDLIIRKTVQYGVLSALLALVYFGMVVLLQTVVGQATDAQSPLVIVVSTLLIAALFAPLRKRVQTAVDRRFYRQKYNAQQVLAQFAQVARDETDMDKLTAELVRVVQETMQPESMVVWFKTVERKVSHE
jgi:hypothetical protein